MHKQNEVLSQEEIARIVSQAAMLHDQVKNKFPSNKTSKKISSVLFTAVRDFVILRLLYATGVKLSELCRLQLSDIDFHEHRVRIKGRNGIRYVRISPNMEMALTRWLTTRNQSRVETGALFIMSRGNPIGPREIQRRIKAYTQMAGIEKNVSPRTIRRSVAYHLVQHDRATYQATADFLGVELPSVEPYLPGVPFRELKKVLQSIHIPNW